MASKAVFHSNLTGLYRALIDQLEGESDFSAAGVAMFTSDASNYRQVPLGVVFSKKRKRHRKYRKAVQTTAGTGTDARCRHIAKRPDSQPGRDT